eukprot:COSAG02_NODE_1114_length_14502_cov_140.830035_9_plen_72_part_00
MFAWCEDGGSPCRPSREEEMFEEEEWGAGVVAQAATSANASRATWAHACVHVYWIRSDRSRIPGCTSDIYG